MLPACGRQSSRRWSWPGSAPFVSSAGGSARFPPKHSPTGFAVSSGACTMASAHGSFTGPRTTRPAPPTSRVRGSGPARPSSSPTPWRPGWRALRVQAQQRPPAGKGGGAGPPQLNARPRWLVTDALRFQGNGIVCLARRICSRQPAQQRCKRINPTRRSCHGLPHVC